MKRWLSLALLLLLAAGARAQTTGTTLFDAEVPRKANSEFQFLAFYINQGVTSNFYPTTEFLRGQVIGRMFGRNTTTTSDTARTAYFEQRIIPFFIYQPHIFDGKAILRAAFEIDWTWGDVNYGTGGNQGGAINGHQVNIQTQNIELELIPSPGWMVNLGLQRMYDSPFNPYRTTVDKMLSTGYRLAYFGTQAVGISLYRDADFHRFKAGFFKFYENTTFRDDDVNMFEFQYQADLNPLWKATLSSHYVRDRGNGDGGVSILGQGLNSQLTEYNGTFRFRLGSNPYKADIVWLGTSFTRNADMMLDRVFMNGFFNYNLGRVRTFHDDGRERQIGIGGFTTSLRMGYRYGQTTADNVNLDLLFASGDTNGLSDDRYSGVMTGNTWAAPGGIFVSSGAYLLFPHANVVNRYTPVVADLSNMGYGLAAATLNYNRALIPHKLMMKLGGATALSQVAPTGGGNFMGIEANGALIYQLGAFMSLELHAAHLWLGSFFDSKDASYSAAVNGGLDHRPVNPYTAFIVYKWLMF